MKNDDARPRSQVENAAYELERLYTDVTSLCGRIELLPCSSAKDRLAQSGESSFNLRQPLIG